MNIFWLDYNPVANAQYHNDKHVVKMCVEYAQLLSGAIRILVPHWCTDTFPYRLTHKNHPCAIWVRESSSNYSYLYQLAIALGDEYTFRYGKKHRSIEEVVKKLPSRPVIMNHNFKKEFTKAPRCMPEEYQDIGDLVNAYRAYYMGSKAHLATWKNGRAPPWWNWNTQ